MFDFGNFGLVLKYSFESSKNIVTFYFGEDYGKLFWNNWHQFIIFNAVDSVTIDFFDLEEIKELAGKIGKEDLHKKVRDDYSKEIYSLLSDNFPLQMFEYIN